MSSQAKSLSSNLPLSYAVNLLSRRDHSEFELRTKMQTKGFSEDEINSTIETCQQCNWLNEQRFAEQYIYMRSQRGYGLKRITQELIQLKGVSNIVVTQAVESIFEQGEIDWQKLAEKVLHKKFANYLTVELDLVERAKLKAKIWRYMLSHGFSGEYFADLLEADF